MAMSNVSGISLFAGGLILPQLICAGCFIFIFLLCKKLTEALQFDSKVVNFTLLLAATLPLMKLPGFDYHPMGQFLFMLLLYLIYKQYDMRSTSNSILLIILASALVITHHYSSFVGVTCLFLFTVLFIIYRHFRVRSLKIHSQPHLTKDIHFANPQLWTIGIIMLIFLFLWWDNYALQIWPQLDRFLTRFIKILHLTMFEPYAPLSQLAPASLKPAWALTLLNLRDMVLVILTVIGFVTLWRNKTKSVAKPFIIVFLFSASLFLVLDLSINLTDPLRIVTYFLPLILFCAALSFNGLWELKRRFLSRALILALVVLFVFSSFIGFHAHRFTPAHYYDPEVDRLADAGDHPIDWKRVDNFFTDYLEYETFEKIAAEDIAITSLILPLNQHSKIQGIGVKDADIQGAQIIVAFRKFNIQTFRDAEILAWYDFSVTPAEWEKEIDMTANQIYNDGKFQIWRR